MSAITRDRRNFNCLTYTFEDIAHIFGISRAAGYNLVKKAHAAGGDPFVVFRLGKRLLVSKNSFDAYLSTLMQDNVAPSLSDEA